MILTAGIIFIFSSNDDVARFTIHRTSTHLANRRFLDRVHYPLCQKFLRQAR
jgi:hypothetical protein